MENMKEIESHILELIAVGDGLLVKDLVEYSTSEFQISPDEAAKILEGMFFSGQIKVWFTPEGLKRAEVVNGVHP